MMMKFARIASAFALVSVLGACDGLLDVNPRASVPREEALDEPDEIAAAVRGIYSALQADGAYDRSLVVYPDLFTDNLEFTGTFASDREFGNRNVLPTNTALPGIWGAAYIGISRANNVLAAIPNVTELDAADAARFRGESLFLRALNYHNLVRWFGGVPIVTEPTWEISDAVNVPRSTQAEVYARIRADLAEAILLLPNANVEQRANRWTARALLARVALEQGDYAMARDMATAVINSGRYSLVEDFEALVRDKPAAEMILAVQYTVNDANALAFWFYTSNLGGRFGFAPTFDLDDEYYFAGDAERWDATIGWDPVEGELYGRKYRRVGTGDDNVPVLRLAEMYLIRAEANARLGAPAQTVLDDVNVVRDRADLPPLTVAGTPDLLAAILLERRLEFAFEGHRFFDLRRILGVAGAASYLGVSQHQLLFPIPQRELDANTALTQNPGY
jgi:starch-binding outer membrane protein, SusD/RagB family